ncbi:MAG: J domain-containing protein [Alphaproteobacteria bacterium]|nr:J domain-containing protein [Alphaproteobacteria bacterium]
MKFTRDIDRIRIRRGAAKSAPPVSHACNWDGCTDPGPHRAPKSPDRLREYYWFCGDHVREYNRTWNFFSGMSSDEVEYYIKGNITGHRPTWSAKQGNPSLHNTSMTGRGRSAMGRGDPFNLFGDPSEAQNPARPPARKWPPLVREAFICMDLEETATLKEIKLRYKELVKRFHPDAHGGDRATEGQLKQVIQAYNRLKASGIK